MTINLNRLQWPVFWLLACLSFACLSFASMAEALAQNFPATEPEFETLRDADSIDNQPITALVQDTRGLIWIGTQTGLVRYDGYRFRKFVYDASTPFSLAGDYVHSLALASDGRLWVGTINDGISVFDPASEQFENFRHDPKKPGSVSGGSIWAFASDGRGGMWIATDQGLDYLPVGSKHFTHFKLALTGRRAAKARIRRARCRMGRFWRWRKRATDQSGRARRKPGGAPVSRQSRLGGGAGFAHPACDQIAGQPRRQRLGRNRGGRGALAARPGQASPGRFEVLTDERGKALASYVYALAEDGQGRIWIGTQNGLWLHEPVARSLIALPAEPNRPDGLVSDFIDGLLFDRGGRLWVATDKGLARLKSRDGKLARFEHVNALLGQPGKALGENLLEDSQGRIWTAETVIDPVTPRMTPLTLAHGMDIGTSWIGSHAQTRDGLLLYGGTQGVAIIDPAQFRAGDYAPPLVVTELKINGEAVAPMMLASPAPKGASATAASLTLKPAQRNFSIEFAALDYAEPKKNRYQYRLLGYEKNWINTDAGHRVAAYGNLWPGQYALQVRSSNRQGQFGAHELTIALHVLPAWWQSAWFWVLALLLAGSMLFGAFRWMSEIARPCGVCARSANSSPTAGLNWAITLRRSCRPFRVTRWKPWSTCRYWPSRR